MAPCRSAVVVLSSSVILPGAGSHSVAGDDDGSCDGGVKEEKEPTNIERTILSSSTPKTLTSRLSVMRS